MELNISWWPPFRLCDGSAHDLIYMLEGQSSLEDLEEIPGVYIFARRYKDVTIPLYVGKSNNLEVRIELQIEKNVKLMKGIQNAARGERILLVGELLTKPGQQVDKALRIIESTLIEHCLAEGYDILNKQGTKRPVHQIRFTENRVATQLTGRLMKVRKSR